MIEQSPGDPQSLQCSKKRIRFLARRDIERAIAFYTQRLGFKLAFGDKADPPNYVGFRRNAVELHMQFQFEHEMGTIRLRFWWTIQTRSSANTVNGVLSAIPTPFAILCGGRANLPSTT